MLRIKQAILASGDLISLTIGLFLALAIRYQTYSIDSEVILPLMRLFLLSVVISFIIGLYEIPRLKNNRYNFQKIAITAGIWMIVGVLYFYINTKTGSPKTILVLTTIFGFGMMALWRFVYNKILSTTILQTNIFFVGSSQEIDELKNIIQNEPQRGLVVADQTNDDADLVRKTPTDIVVVSPAMTNNTINQVLYEKLTQRIQIISLADFYENILGRVPPFTFSENWFITHLQEQDKKIYDRVRMIGDWTGAIIMGIFFILTFPILALIIKINSRGPIFFIQKRVGRDGKIFSLYKYRTMKALAADGSAEISGPQYSSVGDNRITGVGKFLRATRLDEIPQFINILKNQMAFIGPRPERPEFVAQLTAQMPFYALRHLVKPGITGWAQMHSDYYGTIDENLRKLEYDLHYIKNRGFLLDVSIVLRTINVILGMKGR